MKKNDKYTKITFDSIATEARQENRVLEPTGTQTGSEYFGELDAKTQWILPKRSIFPHGRTSHKMSSNLD